MKNRSPKIAVLSGKGGTGKTFVSVNLASIAGRSVYVDCDVEEPNGHLFLKPEAFCEETVTVGIPFVCEDLCSGCRKCVDFCKFNALAFIKGRPYVFEEVCHSCGGCRLLCPEKAIGEAEKSVGKIQRGVAGNVSVHTGILNTGEVSGIPIIKKLLEASISENERPVFIDCPPGSACIVMESIKDADYCILVAEPTVFGVHNLNMVYELVRLFRKPYGAVLNKCLGEGNPAECFCKENDIPVLYRIPFDSRLGTLNANGKIAVLESKRYRDLFSSLLRIVMKEVPGETAVDS